MWRARMGAEKTENHLIQSPFPPVRPKQPDTISAPGHDPGTKRESFSPSEDSNKKSSRLSFSLPNKKELWSFLFPLNF